MNRPITTTVVDIRPPALVSARNRALFIQRVLEGGEVDPRSLPQLVDRARALAFAFHADELVGVGGIKRPSAGHRAHVFASAEATEDPAQFELELGWFYVAPSARNRHVSTRLVEALMKNIGGIPIYATSRVDNERMHSLFARFGFAPIGKPYPSGRDASNIQLFIREVRRDECAQQTTQ